MADDLSLGEAARALDVSVDTVRRWARAGKIATTRDDANRRRVSTKEITRLASVPPATRPPTTSRPAIASPGSSARSRSTG